MLSVTIPERLTLKINQFAGVLSQTPEEFIIEILEERLEHDSAYKETVYLAQSDVNKQRLDRAITDINKGKYEVHGLLND
jgi:hypothetical protein